MAKTSFRFAKVWSDLDYDLDSLRMRSCAHHALVEEGKRIEIEARTNDLVSAVRAAMAPIQDLISPPGPAAVPQHEKAERIATTICAVAKRKGAAILPPDTLFALAVAEAQIDNREFIARLSDMTLSGWLRQAGMQELLEKRGVATWFVERDRQHRLINLDWLTSHADIWRLMLDTKGRGGAHCRFCGLVETDAGSRLLVALRPEERTSGLEIDGSGRRLDLRAASGYAHVACLPQWQKWTAIARQYSSEAEAEAADGAAGRVAAEPIPEPEMPEPEPVDTGERRGYYGSPPFNPDARPTEARSARRGARKESKHGN